LEVYLPLWKMMELVNVSWDDDIPNFCGMMTFLIYGIYMESHSKFHGSSHHQAEPKYDA
jgi:hypothetical protein